jgi:hypothetical protein
MLLEGLATLALVPLLLQLRAGNLEADVSAEMEKLVQQAPFIFRGTVQKVSETTMPSVISATESDAVVKIDEILKAPAGLKGFQGKEITVRLLKAGSKKTGDQAVFFTRGWLYGKGLAVAEVGSQDVRETPGFKRSIAEAINKGEDNALAARTQKADLVVEGKVTAVRQADRARFRSEHDPDWWEATIEVARALKGDPRGRTVTVLYPNSRDEMWIDSPKFKEGEEGIWILQKNQNEKGPAKFRVAGYTALGKLDFQEKNQAERVQRVIKHNK